MDLLNVDLLPKPEVVLYMTRDEFEELKRAVSGGERYIRSFREHEATLRNETYEPGPAETALRDAQDKLHHAPWYSFRL